MQVYFFQTNGVTQFSSTKRFRINCYCCTKDKVTHLLKLMDLKFTFNAIFIKIEYLIEIFNDELLII